MQLAICTKFQVNRMNCVEIRRGGAPIDPPPSPRLRVTIFSGRLLGLIKELFIGTVNVNMTENVRNVLQVSDRSVAHGQGA